MGFGALPRRVWAVRRQEQQVRTSLADGAANRLAFVAAEIVENHDIARLQCGHKELLHPGKEGDGVDGTIQHAGCRDAVRAQGAQEGHGFPVTTRYPRHQALAFRGTAMGSVGLQPSQQLESEISPRRNPENDSVRRNHALAVNASRACHQADCFQSA